MLPSALALFITFHSIPKWERGKKKTLAQVLLLYRPTEGKIITHPPPHRHVFFSIILFITVKKELLWLFQTLFINGFLQICPTLSTISKKLHINLTAKIGSNYSLFPWGKTTAAACLLLGLTLRLYMPSKEEKLACSIWTCYTKYPIVLTLLMMLKTKRLPISLIRLLWAF